MRLYIASWFTPVPSTVLRFGVSRSTPRGQPPGYRRLPELQPGNWLHAPPAEFRELYQAQLSALDARQILAKIETLAAGHDAAALCCWEQKSWCHRAMIADWLQAELGFVVDEYRPGCEAAQPDLFGR